MTEPRTLKWESDEALIDGWYFVVQLECPCCGRVGAEADDDGGFADGQELVCGCDGCVTIDDEATAYVSARECEVDHE